LSTCPYSKDGRDHQILVRKDLTREQLHYAKSFEVGDVLHFQHGSKWSGIRENSYLTVEGVNGADNLLTLRYGSHRIQLVPANWDVQAYTQEHRTLAIGDRLQFRAPDREHKIANRQFATVSSLSTRTIKMRFDDRTWWGGHRHLPMKPSELHHVDHGYCSTSHAAQGATVDRVMVNADSSRSEELVNRQQFYTSISRARRDAMVYTQNKEALRRAIMRDQQEENGLEAFEAARNLSNEPKLAPSHALPAASSQAPQQ